MSSLILYPINIESAPNWVIRKAFARHFSPFDEYDWVNIAAKIGLAQTQKNFLEILKIKQPDYCFMQLQKQENMSVEMIREMAKYTKIINWSGDVREEKEWYEWFIAIGKEIFLTLFSNETDVKKLREAGINADYLQVGFDNVWYNRHKNDSDKKFYPEIVFCANDYGNFPLSKYRVDVALALKQKFGDRFGLFGRGWEKWKINTRPVKNQEESDLYNNCKIAISVSNLCFERYYSDRLLRIMGCGAFPLSHEFPGIEKDFTPGKDIVVFKNIDHLVELCDYYLKNDHKRQTIADNAWDTAHSKCTWDVRCRELIQILEKQNQIL